MQRLKADEFKFLWQAFDALAISVGVPFFMALIFDISYRNAAPGFLAAWFAMAMWWSKTTSVVVLIKGANIYTEGIIERIVPSLPSYKRKSEHIFSDNRPTKFFKHWKFSDISFESREDGLALIAPLHMATLIVKELSKTFDIDESHAGSHILLR